MKLVIVESPTKAKTIGKYLGSDFKVLSSYGHIRDLPKGALGIDVEKDFEPKYVTPTKSRKNLTELKKALEKSDEVLLATDPDREGEAISWHLINALKLKDYKRIVFHEITKSAIDNAINSPSNLDQDLVDAQQARRVLDRIVGYKLSPFLWKKIARGLSAGRVQSVAVRLICDKEKEIEAFNPQEYWSINAIFLKNKIEFDSILTKHKEEKIEKLTIENEKQAEQILNELNNAEYKVKSIEKKETKKNPFAPFTTSTLQQAAWNKLRLSSKMTMSLAQKLYEKGFITYHRTDSLNISNEALSKAEQLIKKNYGDNYHQKRIFKTKGRAQEAHEAIRPSFAEVKELDEKQQKLYDLIFTRFLASQMTPAVFDSQKIEIEANDYTFTANGSTLKFDGFLKIYPSKFEENELPVIEENEILNLKELKKDQHFTKPPARYNEASLVKKLEEYEIGRPSTYAATISTIQDRNYVQKNDDKRFEPTDIGKNVNTLLEEHFTNIVDYKFTAKMEKDLDDISEGKQEWKKIVKDFYFPFIENLKEKEEVVKVQKPKDIETDKVCPKCGKPLVIKTGRFGKFLACTGFPECKYTEAVEDNKTGIKCPQCTLGDIIEKKTRKGKVFYACSNWPDCDFALWDKPTGETCKKCGALMVEKGKKIVCSNKECK
jgi:DNA topoisomerase-1